MNSLKRAVRPVERTAVCEGGVYLAHGEFHQWVLASIPMEIWLHEGVLQRIARDLACIGKLRGAQEEVGGLLLGSRGESILKILTVETYCSITLSQFLTIVKNRMSAPHGLTADPSMGDREYEVLGYYRIQSNDRPDPMPDDLSLMREHFIVPENLFLMLGPSGLGPASFIFLSGQEIKRANVSVPALPRKSDSSPDTSHSAGAQPRWRSLPLWLVVAGAAALLGGTGFIMLRPVLGGSRRAVSEVSKLRPVADAAASARLGLDARAEGRAVRLMWNPPSSDVAATLRSKLLIVDGAEHLDIPLSAVQLGAGRFWYSPAAGYVTFTLEVEGADGRRVAETTAVVVNQLPRGKGENTSESAATSFQRTRPEQLPLGSSVRQPIAEPGEPPSYPVSVEPPPAHDVVEPQPQNREEQPARAAPQTAQPGDGEPRARQIPIEQPLPKIDLDPPSSKAQELAAPVNPPAQAHAEGATTPVAAVTQAAPVVPLTLRKLISRTIVIEVVVSIDASGRVVNAEPSPTEGVLASSLGKIAADTARLWKFQPARKGDKAVPSRMSIRFVFAPGQ